MWKIALDSLCPVCRFTSRPKAFPREPLQPWIVQRHFATQRSQRRVPSRMVLSDRVARPASARGDSSRKSRREVAGPFSGMNRTVANVKPRRVVPATISRSTREGGAPQRHGSRDKGDRERRTFKALKMHQSLTSIGYGQRTHIKDQMQLVESFDQFDLLPAIKEAIAADVLKGMVDIKPTPVQRLAIPALLGQDLSGGRRRRRSSSEPEPLSGKEEFLLAAETGSGKTLAYLLPCINAIKLAEANDADVQEYNTRLEEEKKRREENPMLKSMPLEPHPNTARPRVVVLVPTAELVEQVGAVAKRLSHMVKLKTRMLSAGFSPLVIRNNLFSPSGVDMVISTPHLLASVAESDPNVLSRVTHLVVDEADSLLDRSFSVETTKIIDRAAPSLKQLIMCSATIPKRLDNYLVTRFPDTKRITTPNLHAIPRRVQLGVIDASKDPYRNNKNLACADAIWTIGKEAARHEGPGKDEVDVKRIMVFVNQRETTHEVADYLVSKGIDAVALSRDTPEQRMSDMLASFTSSEPLKASPVARTAPGDAPRGKRSLPNTKVIVATDLASRGIDTLAVRHVVLYDVPHTTIDFIHRLGRAGRMGRRGRGIVLVGKDDRRDIVAEVKESMFMGKALI